LFVFGHGFLFGSRAAFAGSTPFRRPAEHEIRAQKIGRCAPAIADVPLPRNATIRACGQTGSAFFGFFPWVCSLACSLPPLPCRTLVPTIQVKEK
jgi:hypothetical protein